MDWDLWGPPCNQDALEVNSMGHGLDYLDEIEEDALNEKSCIQVLRILISKAHIEIEELEEDLGVLQSQLHWAEQNKYEKWSEICCNSLREKIDSLEISIQCMKNESAQNEHDNAVDSLTHTEPVKKVHEVVKALLRKYYEDKDKQPADIIVKDIQTDAVIHASGQSDDNFDSKNVRKEEAKQSNVTHTNKSMNFSSSKKPEGKRTDTPETLKPADIIVKDIQTDTVIHASGQSDDNFDSKNVRNEEAKQPSVTCTNKSINFSSSKKPEGKRTDTPQTVKPADDIVNGFRSDTSRHATGYYDEKQNLGNFDARTNRKEEVKEPNVTPTCKSIILYSFLKTEEKRTNLPATVKVQEAGFAATNIHTILNSQSKLQDCGAKDIIKAEPVEFQEPRIAADGNTVSLNLSSKSPRQIEEEKIQSNPVNVQEPVVPPTDITPNPSSNKKGKRKEKPGFTRTNNNICLNQPSTEKKAKRKMQLVPSGAQEPSVGPNISKEKPGFTQTNNNICLNQPSSEKKAKKKVKLAPSGAQEPSVAPNISLNILLESQDKRRKSTIGEYVAEVKETNVVPNACSILNGDTTESTTVDDHLQLSNSCNIENSNNEIMGPLPTRLLKDLTVLQLKVLAKEHKMTGYGKMPKAKLVEVLTEKLGFCE